MVQGLTDSVWDAQGDGGSRTGWSAAGPAVRLRWRAVEAWDAGRRPRTTVVAGACINACEPTVISHASRQERRRGAGIFLCTPNVRMRESRPGPRQTAKRMPRQCAMHHPFPVGDGLSSRADTSSRRSASAASERRGCSRMAHCAASGAVIHLGM